MSLIRDALQYLNERFTVAAGPKIIHPDAEPSHVYLVDGVRTVATPATRNHTAADLSAVVAFANTYPGCSVWYNRSLVSCLIDDATRRDRIDLQLKMSPQMLEIQRWGAGIKVEQKPLILKLRTLFKDCQSPCPELLSALRHVKFSNVSKSEAKISPGKSSTGRSIESEVSGTTQLPEDFDLDVPVFEGAFPMLRGKVEVALEVDAEAERFVLIPIQGSDEDVIRKAEAKIGEMLLEGLDDDISGRLYYGRP